MAGKRNPDGKAGKEPLADWFERQKVFLELLVETMPLPVFFRNTEGLYIGCNSAFEELTGLSREEIIGKSVSDIGSREFAEKYAEKDEELYRKPGRQSYEWKIKSRNGQIRDVLFHKASIFGPDGEAIGLVGIITDITEHKKAEEALRKSESLLRISGKLASLGGWSVDITSDRVTWSDEVAAIHGLPPGYSPTVEEAKNFYAPEYRKRINKVFSDCIKYGKPYDEEFELITKNGRRIWVREIGEAVRDGSGKIGQAWGAFQDITSRKNSEAKLRRALRTTIDVLTQTVERRDPYTAGHQRRVAVLAGEIAAEMGLDPERVEGIKMAGYVHDIGKISVPSEILSKPGKLSEVEMNIIREHPISGRDILKDVEIDWPLDEIVYQHHERIDGSGYPRGLKDDDILLEARILCVADVVEAMASHRPYRPTLGLEAALDEIEKNRGVFYDPQVVDICLNLFRKKGYILEE